jgi:hypothetical protein
MGDTTFTVDLATEGTATIRAREPACKCGKRWFACVCDQAEYKYDGPGVDLTGSPRKDFLSLIRGWHPDADLIYIDR